MESSTEEEEAEGEEDEEQLDPRIQVELEKLNSSTDVINKLELDLEEARIQFRTLLNESTRKLNRLTKELGPNSIEKSRGYYDARMTAKRALSEAQAAAARYEKASSAHEAAKEMVTLAEQGFAEKSGGEFDQAWQEMLNHATNRVNDSEREKKASADEHRRKSRAYQRAERRVQELQRSCKRAIHKSRPYFELKGRYNQQLDDQKRQVEVIEETIAMTKSGYADSLKELERISQEIHEKRAAAAAARAVGRARAKLDVTLLGTRGEGVGAEFPDEPPPSKDGKKPPQSSRESPKANKAFSSATAAAVAAADADGGNNASDHPSSSSTEDYNSRVTSRKASSTVEDSSSPCSASAVPSALELRSSVASNPASSSSTNSPVRSPSYEQLREEDDNGDDNDNVETVSKTPRDFRQPQRGCGGGGGGSVSATCSPLRRQVVSSSREEGGFVKVDLLQVRRASATAEELSDCESLASLEMLDDEAIERLMLDCGSRLSLEDSNAEAGATEVTAAAKAATTATAAAAAAAATTATAEGAEAI